MSTKITPTFSATVGVLPGTMEIKRLNPRTHRIAAGIPPTAEKPEELSTEISDDDSPYLWFIDIDESEADGAPKREEKNGVQSNEPSDGTNVSNEEEFGTPNQSLFAYFSHHNSSTES